MLHPMKYLIIGLIGYLILLLTIPVFAVHSVDFPDKISAGLDRPQKMSLDGHWSFETDPQDVGEKDQWYRDGKITKRSVLVPLPWELANEELRNYSGVAWYERTVDIPADHVGRRIALGFDGIAHHGKIWINGQYIGEHFGAQTPFILDITAAAKPGESNTITIRVWNPEAGVAWYLHNAERYLAQPQDESAPDPSS